MLPTELEAVALDAFRYLIDDYGFRYVSTSMHAPECWSTFHNATTAVTVHFELGSAPWVELAELKRHGGRIVEQNRSALEFLVQERAQREETTRVDAGADEQGERAIYEKARQLRMYGEDVLTGDFRIFPRLRQLAEENLRRREASER
jgi:hypothetical protein